MLRRRWVTLEEAGPCGAVRRAAGTEATGRGRQQQHRRLRQRLGLGLGLQGAAFDEEAGSSEG